MMAACSASVHNTALIPPLDIKELKEEHPQVFMQIGWMENDFWKPTVNKLGKFEQSNQELWFFKVWNLAQQ